MLFVYLSFLLSSEMILGSYLHNYFLFFRKEHESCEFEVHEVYAIDILVSSGDGKVGACTMSHLCLLVLCQK